MRHQDKVRAANSGDSSPHDLLDLVIVLDMGNPSNHVSTLLRTETDLAMVKLRSGQARDDTLEASRMRYACPCCGYRTLAEAPGAAREFCEVCAWETRDANDRWSGREAPDLAAAQRSFAERGVCDAALADITRPPRPEEARPAWWTAVEEGARVVTALVEHAFAGVELDGGVSLDEAELIDDYALPARTERDPPPRGYGKGPPWRELTRAGLDRFPWGNFPFQDARGIRYHLPAFMVAHLRGEPPPALDSLLFTLASGHQLEALSRLLTAAQRHAVARYLVFVASSAAWCAESAVDALRKRWGEDIDPDQLAHVASA